MLLKSELNNQTLNYINTALNLTVYFIKALLKSLSFIPRFIISASALWHKAVPSRNSCYDCCYVLIS